LGLKLCIQNTCSLYGSGLKVVIAQDYCPSSIGNGPKVVQVLQLLESSSMNES
jgi:hypothetical protein